LRGDGVVEDVYEDWSSYDERIVGDDYGSDFPLPKGSIPGRIAPPESDTSILHHVLLLLFIVFLINITLCGAILMPFLS
jgi:hypothetical protein